MTLGLLVGRFAAFVIELPAAPEPSVLAEPFARELVRVRDAFGHHLVPLALLARSDGENAPSEREIILHHCLARARLAGMELSLSEQAALSDHLRDFRPTLAQLRPALKRLEHDSHVEIVALIETAKAVVDADGIRRPGEVQFLTQLSLDLAAL